MNRIQRVHIAMGHVLAWMLVLIFPLLSSVLIRTRIELIDLGVHAIDIAGKIIIFYLNLVFLTQYLFKKQYVFYISGAFALVIAISIIQFILTDLLISEYFHRSNFFHPYKIFLVLFTAFTVLGVSSAYALIGKMYRDEKKIQSVERLQIRTELLMLKNQVQPHFFFNTLNNIHYLIETDTHKAQDSIVELSKLLRYLLYETAEKFVELKEEVKFLEHYVSLMKLRIPEHASISITLPHPSATFQLPPLIVIIPIENAFKHCDFSQKNAFISCQISINHRTLEIAVSNSSKTGVEMSKGLGISNLQQRLNLIYGTNYSLSTIDANGIYKFNLILNHG